MEVHINPLSRIIGLSGMLALGFLFVVLATALYGSWMPILDGFLFGFAHIPYLLTNASYNDYDAGMNFGSSDLDGSNRNSISDFGKFVSSFVLTSGFALPITLCRSNVLANTATVLSILGGSLIYSTIVLFTSFFDGIGSSDDPFSM